MAFHDKPSAIAAINAMRDDQVSDGLVIILPKQQARERIRNPQKRFVLTCDEPHARRLEIQRERFIEAVVNKTVFVELVCRALEAVPDEVLLDVGKEEER